MGCARSSLGHADLVPCPGTEPAPPPTLGVQSLSYRTTREVPNLEFCCLWLLPSISQPLFKISSLFSSTLTASYLFLDIMMLLLILMTLHTSALSFSKESHFPSLPIIYFHLFYWLQKVGAQAEFSTHPWQQKETRKCRARAFD